MRRSLVWRVLWMGTLALLFSAGVASGQVARPALLSGTAWSGPFQPDVGGSDNNRPQQSGTSNDMSSGIPADNGTSDNAIADNGTADNGTADNATADNATANNATANNPTAHNSAGDNAANSSANSAYATPSEDNGIRQLGTPFPLQLQPQGLKIGPFYLTSISDVAFYAVETSPGQASQTFAGNSTTANLGFSKQLSRGVLAFQANEQFSISQLQPYFNQTAGLTFSEQLSARWRFNASAQFSYFQNSLLANPQTILSYTNAGVVQQTPYAQLAGNSIYESNNISLTYQAGGRTQIIFTPILGGTFERLQGGWSNVGQFGGGVTVTRSLNPNVSLSGFYNIYHAITSGAASSSPNFYSQNFGISLQGKILQYQSWSLGGSLSLSTQRYGGVYTATPVGSLTLLKTFQGSSISAAYSRSEAINVFASNGYFDQGDISYRRNLGRRIGFNAGVGAFRTVNTAINHENGKRAGGSVSYQWLPRVGLNASYNFAHQSGTQSIFYVGNTSYFSFGLTWLVGAQSGL